MKRTYRYDEASDMVYEVGSNYFEEAPKGPNLITDNMPGGVNGTKAMFNGKPYDSKSAYYRTIKDRGLAMQEPGMTAAKPMPTTRDYQVAVHEAYQKFDGDWNGTASRIRAEDAQKRR